MQRKTQRNDEAIAKHRSLRVIAQDIYTNWKPVHIYAAPYVNAMASLSSMDDKYDSDTALSVVLYFLSNANNWRGPQSLRIKSELKQMCRDTGYYLPMTQREREYWRSQQ